MAKADIKALLKQGLTGREIGKLILEQSLKDKIQAVFTQAEIDTLVNSLNNSEEIRIYNRYGYVYKEIIYPFSNSLIIASFQLLSDLPHVLDTFKELYYYYEIRERLGQVEIMTPKQYEDSKAKMKEQRSSMLFSLQLTLLFIAENFIKYERKKINDIWTKAEKDKEEGKDKKDNMVYGTDILERLFYYYGGEEYSKGYAKETHSDFFEAGIEGFREDFPEFYELVINEAIRLQAEGKLSLSENIDLKTLTPEKAREINLTGEALYNTGIRYLKEVIERYPEDLHKTVAITQNLSEYRTDERGYYRQCDTPLDLIPLSIAPRIYEKKEIVEATKNRILTVKQNYLSMCIIYAAFDALSNKLDIALNEESFLYNTSQAERVRREITQYNEMIKGFLHMHSGENENNEFSEWLLNRYEYLKVYNDIKPINMEAIEKHPLVTKAKNYVKNSKLETIDAEKITEIILEIEGAEIND